MRFALFFALVSLLLVSFTVVVADVPKNAEKNEFMTDVRKMMDIIIHSLYTNRSIFLRELISNGSDALDKIRFLYLTDAKSPVNDAGEEPKMEMYISMDKEARTLTIRDGGVGMTQEELKKNLGSIGSSGTKQFVEKAQAGAADGNMALIGQFGVGFYSTFLVADTVRVASKSDGDSKQWVFESQADGDYYIYEDPKGNTLGRGTEVTLFLKADADEYLEEKKVKEIASKYSEFIHFPIYLQETKTEKVKKESEVEKTAEERAAEEEEGEVADEAPSTEMVDKVTKTWVRVNNQPPIWTRKPADVPADEYKKFYNVVFKDDEDPLLWEHFITEGEVEFKSVLFIPSTMPAGLFEGVSTITTNIKLYVRRVFITDEFKDLVPRYLSFVRGVVDSDDLPLNVSRELLQESRILKIIKKKLVRKILAMIKSIEEEDEKAMEDWKAKQDEKKKDAKAEEDPDVEKEPEEEEPEMKYPKFWKQYGRALRLGLIEDTNNRARISKLLRYPTTKDPNGLMSFETYLDEMGDDQKEIYYIIGAGEDTATLSSKPFLQRFKTKGVNVMLMTEAIDEYVVGHMSEFSGKKLVNLQKEDVKLPGEDTDRARKIFEKRKADNKDFIDWFKGVLGSSVERVTLSERLTESPAIVVSTKYGLTAGMAQIIKGTPLGDSHASAEQLKKVLEVNIDHPIVRTLRQKMRADKESSAAKDQATLLYESAAFESGFPLDNSAFVARLQRSLAETLAVESLTPLEPEPVEIEEEEEKPDMSMADETEADIIDGEPEAAEAESGEL